MCGIGGCVLEPGRTPPADRLEALRGALGHRGPDDSGVEVVDNVGLVHTRLAIVDPGPSSHQPMRHPRRGFWLVYNGEVYNHAELRREFGSGCFTGHSDTETVVWALQRSGLRAVPRLNGQFAFAALDLERRTLLLCRDRFGIKPLYVARFAGGVWFASEPAALISAGAPARPVSGAYGAILAGSHYAGTRTLVESIARIGPGAWVSVPLDGGPIRSGRWFAPSLQVDGELAGALEHRSRSQLADELRARLSAAVRRSLMSDVEVGLLLSGGVDSSLIAAMAVRERPDLVAFGATCASDRTHAEGAAARSVAARLGVELDLVEVTPQSWCDGFVAATAHFGSPLTNASAVTVAELAGRAHDAGIKVLLTGEGADELFGGYGTLHAETMRAFQPAHHRLLQRIERALVASPEALQNPVRELRRLRLAAARALTHAPTPGWTTLSAPTDGPDTMREALLAYVDHAPARCRAEAELLSRMDYTLSWLLNRLDKNLMQRSVEGRVPFLDPEVVRLVVNLPLEARTGPWSKGILRDVARTLLPLRVAHRPKVYGMDLDAGSWIEERADPSFLADGLLRETLEITRDELGRTMMTADGRLRVRIWSAEVWCRSVIAGHSVDAIEQALWG